MSDHDDLGDAQRARQAWSRKSDPEPPVTAAREGLTQPDKTPLMPGVGIDRDVARDTLRTELK